MLSTRPIGQAVKTLASHAGNSGSIPGWVTNKRKDEHRSSFSFVAGSSRIRAPRICIGKSDGASGKQSGRLKYSNKARTGSIPGWVTKKCSLLSQRAFFYPLRSNGISSPREVRCISSAPLGLYIITRQRASQLRNDDIQTFGLMIYKACALVICNSFGVDILPRSSFSFVAGSSRIRAPRICQCKSDGASGKRHHISAENASLQQIFTKTLCFSQKHLENIFIWW